MTIIEANSVEQFNITRNLFREYEKELNIDLCFQGFADELKNLPGKYGPPDGALLLAMENSQAIGCVALRQFSPSDSEMKRLYVQPSHRHLGFGRLLVQRVVARACELGYRRMLLDTLETMHGAQDLYRSLGFVAIDRYYDNPWPSALYFAKELTSS